jgi:predicted nucleotide-binding protein
VRPMAASRVAGATARDAHCSYDFLCGTESGAYLMSGQHSEFVHTLLEYKLQERLDAALSTINSLSKEDVLQCDGACLTEIVRQFAVAAPILQPDQPYADERIGEVEDILSGHRTGQTNHSFFIPIERGAEWLEDVGTQRVASDGYPLAFLDKERAWIDIRLMLSPEDEEGTLGRKLKHRTALVEQYADSVAERLVEFNRTLAEKMAVALNTRKKAIAKAEQELAATALPQVHNPAYSERAIKLERILQGLGTHMTGEAPQNDNAQASNVRSFIVHGHDHQSLLELKDYLQNALGLDEPVVLQQMPGQGRTLIEKFESEAEATELVFVLLTPDDKGANPSDTDTEKRRARQNVIFEMGFFLGKLGRTSGRVLLLYKGSLDIPSDIAGIEYIDITNGIESAGEKIRKELRASGVLR